MNRVINDGQIKWRTAYEEAKKALTGSAPWRMLVRFLAALYALYTQSVLYAVLSALVDFFSDSYAASKTRRVLIGKGGVERFAETSIVYRALGGAVGRILSVFTVWAEKVCANVKSSHLAAWYGKYFKRSFYDNYTAFTAFVCMVIFAIPHNFWSNTFGILFAAILFVLYVAALTGSEKAKHPGTNFDAVWFSILLFGFSLLVGCVVSYDRVDSIRVLLFFVTSFMLCMALYASVRGPKELESVGAFMYAVLLFTSAVALLQRLSGVEADAALTDMDLNAGMPGRVFSTLGNPNNFAEFLVLFMPFALAFALGHEKGSRTRKHCLAGMLLPLAAILLTYSRSGWIALAIAAVIFIALYDKRNIPLAIGIGLCLLPFIPRSIWNRVLTIGDLKDTSSSYRLDIWTGCLSMLKDYWYTGVGLGTGGFAEIYPQYAVGTSGIAPHSHMHFMEMLIELGPLGFVSYIYMTFSLIRRSFAASSRKTDPCVRNYAIASAASMTGIVLIGCFEYCWFYPRVMFAFFVCAGLAMAVWRMAKSV